MNDYSLPQRIDATARAVLLRLEAQCGEDEVVKVIGGIPMIVRKTKIDKFIERIWGKL